MNVSSFKRKGFTLIELLVVIAIIAILAAILFPVFTKAREKARQTRCMSNQKQIALAFNMYAQDHGEKLPAAKTWATDIDVPAGMFDCPSDDNKGNASKPDYFYVAGDLNGQLLAEASLSEMDDPSMVVMTADYAGAGGEQNPTSTDQYNRGALPWYNDYVNPAANPPDIVIDLMKLKTMVSDRHNGAIASYVDGHVAFWKASEISPFKFIPSIVRKDRITTPIWLDKLFDKPQTSLIPSAYSKADDSWRTSLEELGFELGVGVGINAADGKPDPAKFVFSDGSDKDPTVFDPATGSVTGTMKPSWWTFGSGQSTITAPVQWSDYGAVPPFGKLPGRKIGYVTALNNAGSSNYEAKVDVHIVPNTNLTAKRIGFVVINNRDCLATGKLNSIKVGAYDYTTKIGAKSWKTEDGHLWALQAGGLIVPVNQGQAIDISFSALQYAGGHRVFAYLFVEK